jgi:citrate lyase subunit beta/citryl-CoA lyase
MRFRSMLIVPGDRPDEMALALEAGADALMLDLADTIAAPAKPEARRAVADFLGRNPGRSLWVRINPLDSPDADKDLAAIVSARPDGLVLPRAEGGASVAELARRLTERSNVGAMIMPMATDTPSAIFEVGSYEGVKRLAALTWSFEALTAAVGASEAHEEDGSFIAPCELARSLCLFGAAAAGVPAIDAAFRGAGAALERYAQRARRHGFAGMLAIDADQVPVINHVFG